MTALSLQLLWRRAEQRLNRPLWRREPPTALAAWWDVQPLLQRLGSLRPALLLTVTTFGRPAEAAALVSALAGAWRDAAGPRPFVCVFNDRSDADYGTARALLQQHFGDRSAWLDARQHLGKRGFWRTHQLAFLAARAAGAEHLLSLQDDVQLAPDFVARLWRTWEATGVDARRRVLYLFASADDEADGRWIRFARQPLPGASARRTDWFDLQGFLIDRRGLELLRHWVVPIPAARWRNDPALSSGVGRQFTQRLFGRATVYQCDPPLIAHGAVPSVMNAQARSVRALDNRALVFGEPPIDGTG